MTVAYLLKHDKFGSNFVLIKQNLPYNAIILPPKNGGFKARSHSVRKANWFFQTQELEKEKENSRKIVQTLTERLMESREMINKLEMENVRFK